MLQSEAAPAAIAQGCGISGGRRHAKLETLRFSEGLSCNFKASVPFGFGGRGFRHIFNSQSLGPGSGWSMRQRKLQVGSLGYIGLP